MKVEEIWFKYGSMVFSKLWHTTGDHLKDFSFFVNSWNMLFEMAFLSCRIFTLSAFERRLFQINCGNMCLKAMFCRWWENTFSAFEILFLAVNSRYMFLRLLLWDVEFSHLLHLKVLFGWRSYFLANAECGQWRHWNDFFLS